MRVLVMLAQCQKENAKPAEAEKTLRRALAQQEVPELYIPLGDVLQLQKKYLDAAQTFVRAAEIFAKADETKMEAAASIKAARVYYLLDRHGLAMKYIDRAAALVDDPEVRQWQRKIEDARFGQPDARFGQPDARFSQPDARFSQPDARFSQPDAQAAPPPVLPASPLALPLPGAPLTGAPGIPSAADPNAAPPIPASPSTAAPSTAPPSTKPAGGLLDFK